MLTYLTEAAFRNQGLGVDLSPFSSIELRTILQGATARVNAYCSTANLPQPHDFRGSTITAEKHIWNLNIGQRRVYPWHQPVMTVTGFRIKVTEGNYIVIAPTDIFTNNSSGYVEIVALTLGIGIFPVLANLSLSQPVSEIDYTYGTSFPVVGEVLYEDDGQTFQAANQWWDSTVAPKIFVDGVDKTTDFTLDLNEGTATHGSTELTADNVVTANYNYRLHPSIARATGVIAADEVAKARIRARGLAGLASLRVGPGEVEMRPSTIAVATRSSEMPSIPEEAAWLLEPFRFRS